MAHAIVGFIVLVLLCWLPGAAITRFLFGAEGPPTTEKRERAFLAVVTSLLLTGWLGFTLAQMGWFSVWLILLIELAICFGLLWAAGGSITAVPRTAKSWLAGLGRVTRGAVRRPSWPVLALLGLLALGAVLYSRPAEMIRGALDAGAYINAGVALGQSGSIVDRDRLMRELLDPIRSGEPSEGREFLQGLNPSRYVLERMRMIGFFVLDKQDAQVLPQHYSFFPVWIAIFYQLFGLWGALWASPFLALAASAAIYFFTVRIFTRSVGLLALGLLVVFPLQSWFARYPVSETPTQLLAFVFFYAFARFVTETRRLGRLEGQVTAEPGGGIPEAGELERVTVAARFFAVLSAVALGEIALTRPDFPAFLVPLPFFMIWWWWSRSWRREHTWFAATLLILFAQWLLHFYFFTYAYTLDLYYNTLRNMRRAWPRILPLVYVGTLAAVGLVLLRGRLLPLARSAGEGLARRRAWLLTGLSLLAGLYILYRYVVEPEILTPGSIAGALGSGVIPFDWQGYIGAPLRAVEQTGKSNQEGLIDTNSFILVRVGWYLSPLGIVLGSIGLLRALWMRLNAASAAFFISLGVFGVVFFGQTFTDPTYPYTMRRFMPVIAPALLIFAAYAVAWIGERWRPRALMRVAGWGLYLALGLFFVYTSLPMLAHVEEEGAIEQVQSLAERFPNPGRTVLVFSNERDEPYIVATPLQYIFGLNVFSLNLPYGDTDPADVQHAMQRWLCQGYDVYAILGANGGKLDLPAPPIGRGPAACAGDGEAAEREVVQPLALVPLEEDPSWTYSVPEFEQLRTQKPKNIQRSELHWGIYRVVPAEQAQPRSWPLDVDIGGFDYEYMLAGFSAKECHQGEDRRCLRDGGYWRWTYRDALLQFPWRATEGMSATLTLSLTAGPPERGDPAVVRVAANGAPAGEVTLQPGEAFREVSFKLPPQPAGEVLIHISSSVWSPRDEGVSQDPRVLGVRVDSARIGE